MKRFIALFTALTMTTALVGCGSSSSSSDNSNNNTSDNSNSSSSDDSSSDNTAASTSSGKNQLIIGSTTLANADFLSGWTNNAVNSTVRTLMSGGGTLSYTPDGTYVENPQVLAAPIESVENADGTKTFTIKIKDTLKYNDGTPITAKDYVFSTLLGGSPEFGDLDASNLSGINFVGFEAYNKGESRTFSGIRLLGDYEFSYTVKAEELPYYYDNLYASAGPSPMHVLAPGVDITDDGNGATISDNFTVELLQQTITDPTNGYRYNPTVTSGPYQFKSYDSTDGTIIIEINPNFEGTYDGVQPSIETIIFKNVVNATQFDELAAGSVGLLSGISGGDSINTGLDLVDSGLAGYTDYPRNGYGKIAFACNFGPTESSLVRQAIAYTLDRDEFAKEYTGGFGQLTNGYYGLAQWEYRENKDALTDNLISYTKNLAKAEELLDLDGWNLNSSGGAYTKGTDTLRYKSIDGELVPLIIEWANTPDNPVSDLLSAKLPDAMAEVGMQLNSTTIEFTTLLEYLYQTGGQQKYHMYNMATSFATTSAPWYYYNVDLDTYGGTYNTSFLVDQELHDIGQSMKSIEAGDFDTWSEQWLDLQIRWNELVPDLPLYSDQYHEFFTPELQGYTPSALWSVTYAIVYASLS